jgi:hypothetical protein
MTIFRSENTSTPLDEIEETARFSGLEPTTLMRLRPDRLVLHELLIRIMTELTVEDGKATADLGVNFRTMAARLLHRHIDLEIETFRRQYEEIQRRIDEAIHSEIRETLDSASARLIEADPLERSWLDMLLLRPRPARRARIGAGEQSDLQMFERWLHRSASSEDAMLRSCYRALHHVATGIHCRHGSLAGAGPVLAKLACTLATNEHASERLGASLDPLFRDAAAREGFRLLPSQSRPSVMNTKGASAAGKSSMRPQQRALAGRLGLNWLDFALISPDIIRKFLLDYNTLGPARRYAGALTAHEVEIIDRKLDRYVATRAQAGRLTHMLIDRFRFDSFAPEGAADSATQLLTRFGSDVYMFFVITPPEATVVRAWRRGEEVGRYKAVDDLLAHNIEAYTGMPGLFFRWAASAEKIVHYEFLDNGIDGSELPRCIAFGQNGEMTILDVEGLMNIDRFRKINISATSPSAVYPDKDHMRPDRNTGFLRDCVRRIPRITFAAQDTGEIYGRIEGGRVHLWRSDALQRAVPDPSVRAALEGIAPAAAVGMTSADIACHLERGGCCTLGDWGPPGPRSSRVGSVVLS